jgi:xylulokinase
MGVTLAAGGSLRWFRDELGQMEVVEAQRTGKDTYRLLTSMADKATPGSEGLFFLPYLSGERTPYPDPFARGSFIGLTTRHGRPELVRSLLEGVAFSLKDCLELVKSTGVEINQIRISGGGARSPIWRQIMANVFEHELVTLTSTEGAPYGAALLAAVGTGYFQSVREACGATLVIDTRTVPDQSQISLYRQAYDVYRGLYHALKPAFELIANPERK